MKLVLEPEEGPNTFKISSCHKRDNLIWIHDNTWKLLKLLRQKHASIFQVAFSSAGSPSSPATFSPPFHWRPGWISYREVQLDELRKLDLVQSVQCLSDRVICDSSYLGWWRIRNISGSTPTEQPTMTLFILTTWLGYVNSALNPIIYTIFNGEFR